MRVKKGKVNISAFKPLKTRERTRTPNKRDTREGVRGETLPVSFMGKVLLMAPLEKLVSFSGEQAPRALRPLNFLLGKSLASDVWEISSNIH